MNNKNTDKKLNSNYIFTRETLGMTILLFCLIVFIMLFTGSSVFAGIGRAVCTFLYGSFGYGSYLLIALLAYLGEVLVFGKKIKLSFKGGIALALTVFVLFLLFHSVSTRNYALTGYSNYVYDCYKNAANGFAGYTFGGVISAAVVYPFAKYTTFVGAYIIFSILTIACGYLVYFIARGGKINRPAAKDRAVKDSGVQSEKVESASPAEHIIQPEPEYSVPVAPRQYNNDGYAAEDDYNQQSALAKQTLYPRKNSENEENRYSSENLGRKILFEKGEFDAESYKRNMIFSGESYFNRPSNGESGYLSSFSSGNKTSSSGGSQYSKPAETPPKTYSESYQEELINRPDSSMPTNYLYGDKPVDRLEDVNSESGDVYSVHDTREDGDYAGSAFNVPIQPEEEERFEEIYRAPEPSTEPERPTPFENPRANLDPGPEENRITEETEKSEDPDMYKLFGADNPPRGENRVEPDLTRLSSRERTNANLFDYEDEDDDDEDDDAFNSFTRKPSVASPRSERNVREFPVRGTEEKGSAVEKQPAAQTEKEKQEEKPKHVWKKYVRPTLDLLDDYPEHSNVNTGEIEDSKRTIVETLERFKIDCEISNVTIGPAITRFDVIIEDKTKIKQSLNYREAIAMALRKENVQAYLNFSKGALSIEVPNNSRTVIGLKSILSSSKFINSKTNSITFALGKNVDGEVVCPDITKMPHLLVAGTTGSGKSICLSSLIISLLYKYGPEELRFILVDPKQVEFITYDKLPHLMINEIIYEIDKAIKALNWAIKEMERRYSLFKEMTEKGTATKNLDEYNSHLPEGEEKLPKIVIILDEFGDLMLQAKKDIESRIIKLVQKARACGIHLILATQRPSVDCITGLIKSNLPTRIGFKVNSFDDSRTIFDIGGAEKLLGKGDLYFRSAENPDLARIQGCFVDTPEVQRVTDFVKEHNETYFDQSVSDFINTVEAEEQPSSIGGGEEEAAEGDTKIDDTYIKALFYCVTSNQASVSMIQRRFPVGYIKACKIIDWMENMNYITPSEGSKPRKVLLSKDEFINTYGEVDD